MRPFPCDFGTQLALYTSSIRRLGKLLLTSLSLAVLRSSAQAEAPYPFNLDLQRHPQGIHVVARNGGPVPVSARVSLEGTENAQSDQSWPVSAVIPAHSSLDLGELRPRQRDQALRVGTRVSWLPGDYQAQPDPDALYRLPFADGERFTIGQAPGGPIVTHTTPGSAFAVDIPMPEGTPILASRSGVVMDTEAVQSEGGTSQEMLTKANSIRILHADGTIGVYAHLAYGAVFVYRGQKVEAGQEIGRCGSTGFSTGPHLHYAVQKLAPSAPQDPHGFEHVSIPFRYYVGTPPRPFSPAYGLTVTADYRSSSPETIKTPSPIPTETGLHHSTLWRIAAFVAIVALVILTLLFWNRRT